ncbi:MAG: IS256 family transposase [Herpetosiphonaceae bacterium]|nr:IS256 family transposase [Herpetosiphonaceae bacterium]
MTYQADCTLPSDLLEQISEGGFDALPDAIRLLLNTAMLLERQKFLGVDPYARSAEHQAHAHGFKEKTVQTRLGALTLAVPQVREGGFYPQSLEKGVRSERALKLALAEMYVQGVSTRKVAASTEQLCGFEVTSTQVSRAAAELDGVLAAWRSRPLAVYRYVYLDARYEQVRQNGQVRDAAVLLATGVDAHGKRAVLGVSVALSEQEVQWRTFLQSLVERGLRGVELLISDAHAGLQAARKAVFGGVPWQRCQFHLQQNAQAYVPKQAMKGEVATALRAIFQAVSLSEAKRQLAETVGRYQTVAPKLARWMEENVPEGLLVFAFPQAQWRRLRTTNGLERLNQEIRRRTRVARLFPNEASCLRLVTAVVMEISDDWETGNAYLTFED